MSRELGEAGEEPADAYRSSTYRLYVVALLMLIYACHALDRRIPNILL